MHPSRRGRSLHPSGTRGRRLHPYGNQGVGACIRLEGGEAGLASVWKGGGGAGIRLEGGGACIRLDRGAELASVCTRRSLHPSGRAADVASVWKRVRSLHLSGRGGAELASVWTGADLVSVWNRGRRLHPPGMRGRRILHPSGRAPELASAWKGGGTCIRLEGRHSWHPSGRGTELASVWKGAAELASARKGVGVCIRLERGRSLHPSGRGEW